MVNGVHETHVTISSRIKKAVGRRLVVEEMLVNRKNAHSVRNSLLCTFFFESSYFTMSCKSRGYRNSDNVIHSLYPEVAKTIIVVVIEKNGV